MLILALAGSVVAAAVTRSVRDKNEDRLLLQRAEAIGQLIEGLGSSFEGDLLTAAAYASVGTPEEFLAYVDASRQEATANSAWALVDRTPAGHRARTVAPPGGQTYFDGPRDEMFERRLIDAFGGDFTIIGMLGTGAGRRLGLASGVPKSPDRIVYLEFPLLAAAASSADEPEGLALFEDVHVGVYVGAPTDEGEIFATYDGEVPSGSTTLTFDLAGERITVVVQPMAPLSGGVADALPTIVFGFGISLGILAALLAETARRKQRAAVAQAEELRVKHEALEDAMNERDRAEAGLLAAQRRETLGQLAGGIAHDFNNLLAAISSFAELAAHRVTDPSTRADLAEVLAATQRGAALTRQLMMFTRSDLPRDEWSDLNVVIRELASLLERTVGDDVDIVIDLGPDAAFVAASQTELEQVLVNLVVNARHAISGPGTICIHTRNDGARHHVMLEVADDGAGMPVEVAARALEPFFTTRPAGEGTGLGLATVDSIVQRAGGAVTIDSMPDGGTTIRIVLPLRTAGGIVIPASSRPLADVASSATVLLVEDAEPVRRAVRRMLEGRGYRVHEAVSGADAVTRYLDTSLPDVLVTDVVMPGGVSGSDLVERFRVRQPNLPVVLVSGHAPARLADLGIPAAPIQLLAKPFGERDLVAAISAAIGAPGS